MFAIVLLCLAMISIEDRYWPLVLFRFSGKVTLEELNVYLKRQDEFMLRNQKTGSLVLTDNLKMWDTPVLRRQAEWIKQNLDALSRFSVGAALVINSPIVRGMLRAILWIQPMPQPHLVCSSPDEGLRWLRARFMAADVALTLPQGHDL
jgi:hypothetical protein